MARLRQSVRLNIWCACTSVVFFLLARGLRSFRLPVWFTLWSDEVDFCTVQFVLKNPTLWNDQNMFFDNFENSDVFQKLSF
jgi:predicted nucleotidyltransferase